MQDYVLTVKQSATFSTQTVVKFKFKLRTILIGKPLSVKPKYVWTLKVISMDPPSIAPEAPAVSKRCRITRGEKENKIQVPRKFNVLRETKREKRRNKGRVRMKRGRRIRRRLAVARLHTCLRQTIQGRLHGPHKGLVRRIIRSCLYTGIRKYVTSARVPTEMGERYFVTSNQIMLNVLHSLARVIMRLPVGWPLCVTDFCIARYAVTYRTTKTMFLSDEIFSREFRKRW